MRPRRSSDRVVLLTQRLVENDTYPEQRECLDVRWARFLRACGFLPVPMAIGVEPDAYLGLGPVGIVLTGGNDLGCCGGDALSRTRDAYERRVLALTEGRSLPILAVCRGAQLVASEAGAAMFEREGHAGCHHGLVPEPGAPFAGLLGEVRSVSSFHKWSPGPPTDRGWRVAARAPDGAIEALAHEDRRVLGIMWHPERYGTPRTCDVALARAVIGWGPS
jgi:putative glutamine amidotransferase